MEINSISTLSIKSLAGMIHSALRSWNVINTFTHPLLISLWLLQTEEPQTAPSATSRLMEVVLEAISVVEASQAERPCVVRYRFIEGLSVREVVRVLQRTGADPVATEDSIQREQREQILQMAEWLWCREVEVRKARLSVIESRLPLPTYRRAIGLEAAVSDVGAKILASPRIKVAVISGIGGIGKTTLADLVARYVIRSGTLQDAVWVTLEHESRPNRSQDSVVRALASHFQIYDHDSDIQSLKRAVLSCLYHTKALVVLDDIETLEELEDNFDFISESRGESCFLVTSRVRPHRVKDSLPWFEYHLDGLPSTAALELLQEYGAWLHPDPAIFQANAQTHWNDLYEMVGGNPLALRLVASMSRFQPFTALMLELHHIRRHQVELLFQSIFRHTWLRLSGETRLVLLTLLFATPHGTNAEHLLRVTGMGPTRFWNAIEILHDHSLIEIRYHSLYDYRLSLHHLTEHFLRLSAQQVAGDSGLFGEAVPVSLVDLTERNLAYWLQETAGHSTETLQGYAGYLPQLRRALDMGLQQGHTIKVATLFGQLFDLVERRGYYQEWLPRLEQVIARAETLPELLLIRCLHLLSALYRHDGAFNDAFKTLGQAFEVALRTDNTLALAQTHLYFSGLYRDRYENIEAQKHAQQALQLLEPVKTAAPPWYATALNALGIVAHARGQMSEAETYLRRAYTQWLQLPDTNREVARVLKNLGLVLQAQAQYDEALLAYREAKTRLPRHDSLERSLLEISLGSLYYQRQSWVEAQTAFQEANPAYLAAAGFAYYHGLVLHNLGNVYLAQEDHDKARDLLTQAVMIWRELDDPIMLANSIGTLGEVDVAGGLPAQGYQAMETAVVLVAPYLAEQELARQVHSYFTQLLANR